MSNLTFFSPHSFAAIVTYTVIYKYFSLVLKFQMHYSVAPSYCILLALQDYKLIVLLGKQM